MSTDLDLSIPSSDQWISLGLWATELDTSLSSSIGQPSSICRYRARGLSLFRGDKVKTVIELDDLSSSVTYRISLVFWVTELHTRLSSSICQPASINKSSSGNRARYGFIEVDISTGLDELIDLGKPSSICRYRARIVEDCEARTPTFPGGQVEYHRAR